MCGFAGFCSNDSKYSENGRHIAEKMADILRHRGPDSGGTYSDGFFSAGFCRLKIIDLNGGEQPMTDQSGRYTLCFNGEIYNYRELAKQLFTDYGMDVSDTSDTEVLLYAYIAFGRDVVRHLRGMYSFVLYDREEKTVFCARDPFGIKPFYYTLIGNTFLFASEIKAFYAHPDFKADFNAKTLPLYLQFQYVPENETAFKGVFRLKPGHFAEFDGKNLNVSTFFEQPLPTGKRFRPYAFFGAQPDMQEQHTSLKDAVKLVSETVSNSVETHKNADVPVGTFLSGGVDSAFITALAKPKRAYTVGFNEEGFDERAAAKENAKTVGVDLSQTELTADDFFRALPAVQYHSDEPCANLSAVPLYLLAERASADVKVILSGEGADELFAGYSLYSAGAYGRLYRKLPKKLRVMGKKLRFKNPRIRKFIEKNAGTAEEDFIGQARIMSPSEAYYILSPRYKHLTPASEVTKPIYEKLKSSTELQKMMYLDRRLWLPFDILNKADKMTMAHSLELRVPYLDLHVLGVAQSFSDKLLINKNTGKYVLRKAAVPYIGKNAFRAKKGFPVPFRSWIKRPEYEKQIREAFASPTCAEFFESDKLTELLDNHIKGTGSHARLIYTVYSFIIWHDIFFGAARPKFFTADETERSINNMHPTDLDASEVIL